MLQVKIEAGSETDLKKLNALIKKTDLKNPKDADVQELRMVLIKDARLVESVGNLGKNLVDSFAKEFTQTAFHRESLQAKLNQMRDNLGYERASVLEQILIDQVLVCWLRLNRLEIIHHQKTTASHTTETGVYFDKCLTQSQRRFTRACETLARVRKTIASANAKNAEAIKNLLHSEK